MRKLLFLAPLLAPLSGCDVADFAASAREHEDFHYTFELKPGGKLALENFNGPIEIRGSDSGKVEINGSKYAPTREQLAEIKIETMQAPGAISIRTMRPVERHGNSGARYVITVPRQIILDRIATSNGSVRIENIDGTASLRTSNGQVSVSNLTGALDVTTSNAAVDLNSIKGQVTARTSNGRIEADRIEGAFQAGTSNGSIRAVLSSIGPAGLIKATTSNGAIELTMPQNFESDVRASSSNGGITLHLPAGASARIVADTSNSSISSDFDLNGGVQMSKKHVEGQIGSGGPHIDLHTSNGRIRLVKSL